MFPCFDQPDLKGSGIWAQKNIYFRTIQTGSSCTLRMDHNLEWAAGTFEWRPQTSRVVRVVKATGVPNSGVSEHLTSLYIPLCDSGRPLQGNKMSRTPSLEKGSTYESICEGIIVAFPRKRCGRIFHSDYWRYAVLRETFWVCLPFFEVWLDLLSWICIWRNGECRSSDAKRCVCVQRRCASCITVRASQHYSAWIKPRVVWELSLYVLVGWLLASWELCGVHFIYMSEAGLT